ncbi:MAG: phosphatidate cytidylyltransferase [Trueperaceae bacterium]|nr:phosphatidate cytidylyltransferase [Trueperaceae bacterium]
MSVVRVTSAFLAFLATLVVLWVGLPLLGPAYLILTGIAVQEYATMLALRGVPVRRKSLWVATALTLPASLPAGHPWMAAGDLGLIPWRELLLIGFVLYLFVAEVVTSNRSSLQSLAFTMLGYVWISWGFGLVLTLRYTPDGVTGLWYLSFPVLAIIATDVGGYVFGTLWGKRPLAPRISPKKTIEGAIGGQVLAMVVVGGTMALLPLWTSFRLDLLHVLVFAVIVPMAALAGDLFESLVKRWVGVKDAGVFLPGHGGVLDRLDSHLIAVPVTYVLVTLLLR